MTQILDSTQAKSPLQPKDQLSLPPHLVNPEPTPVEEKPQRQAPPRGRPLRQQLLLFMIPTVVLPLIGVGGIRGVNLYQEQRRRIDQALADEVTDSASGIESILQEWVNDLAILGNTPLLREAILQSRELAEQEGLAGLPVDQIEERFANERVLISNPPLNDYLRQSTTLFTDLTSVLVTQEQGFNVAYSTTPPDVYQLDEEEWQSAHQGSIVFQNPQTQGDLDGATLDILTPISPGGVIQGTFALTPITDTLADALMDLSQELGLSGQVVQILDDRNQVILSLGENGLSPDLELLGGETLLQRISDIQQTDPMIEGVGDVRELVLAGREFGLAIVPSTGWTVISSVPLQVLRNLALQELLFLLPLILLAAGLATAVVVFVARQISKPLAEITYTAQSIAQGNLEAQAQGVGTAESQTLAQTLNTLVKRVKALLQRQEEAARAQLQAQQEIAQQQEQAARAQLQAQQEIAQQQEQATRAQLQAQQEIAQQQEQAARQQQEAKEFLQNRALELLMEVAPLRQGDLTIRANVTEDEVGTIADSYNATIGSLRKIVRQVKAAAEQVAHTADQSEGAVQTLAQDALQQADAIQTALGQIEVMHLSMEQVAEHARQADRAVQKAGETVAEGDQAMDRTVEGILSIRATVAETAKKVKQLGESSQKISRVVNLIGGFAAQTNLLALNASIEAARAGEEGRGFAVVADEVRSLARQSTQATAEIEQLVTSIQSETHEVVAAMEQGTQEVVIGTQRVEETRQSLNRITEASQQISQLVQSIAQAAVEQSQMSTSVSATMAAITGVSNTTSQRADQVQAAFEQLMQVAQELQSTVGQFKLN